jgi:hypothetical protein
MTSEVNQNGKLTNEGIDGNTHHVYNHSLLVRRKRIVSASLLVLWKITSIQNMVVPSDQLASIRQWMSLICSSAAGMLFPIINTEFQPEQLILKEEGRITEQLIFA